MTQKEKAIELTDTNRWWLCTKEQCKKYASVVVDEILQRSQTPRVDDYYNTEYAYWKGVKEEIEKL